MCGIVGIVARPGAPAPERRIGSAMNAAIRHRGPDDEGIYADAQAMIGMRRLSIIDLATGHQPIANEDGSVQMVFNGEIYNYRELRDELKARGHRFHTQSDSEVIVQAYVAFGEACFERLHGMFAIAIWDTKKRTLLLARDRFGEKPLFYGVDSNRIIFGSELKSLLQVPGFSRDLNADAVRSYVSFGYVPAPASIFASVKKLAPGHYLKYAEGRVEIRPYWSLAFEPASTLGEAEAEDELARLLDQAVSSRLVSDVPFGAFLSGGLDSSVVVALMSRHLQQPVQTFSIGFKEAQYNELSDARRVATHLGTEHQELIVEPDSVDLMHKLVWYLDEPFADSSAVPTYLVAEMARNKVKMVLTGDGGDESFGGYDRYLKHLTLQRIGVAKPLVGLAANVAGRILPGSRGYRLRRIGERLRQPFPDSYLSGVALTRADLASALLGDTAVAGTYSGIDIGRIGVDQLGGLDRIVAIDFASYLPDDVLVKLDRMAMANSLEGRSPLLDHRLVEFAVRLPEAQRIRGGRGKHLLRKVAARWLPPDVLAKPKQGFGIPLGDWMRGPLQNLARDTIASRAFRERGLIDPKAAQACLDTHLRREADMGETLWLILSLELWAKSYLDVATPATNAA
ncbi:MAG TPA: asparagine synthase (glutamine-hydrolyzing) [Rhodanobacteraceae bacterium]|nr:asparagine synthase (glutamine-hydrolyzing) [Rhodanobacteraceae bacterium]